MEFTQKYTCIITVPIGVVEFMIVNRKKSSQKKDHLQRGFDNTTCNWFAFKSLSKKSLVANLINGIHIDSETKKSKEIKNIFIK